MLTPCYCVCWLIFAHTPAKPRLMEVLSNLACAVYFYKIKSIYELMSFLLTGIISLRVKCSDPLKISVERAVHLKSLKVKIPLIDILTLFN